MEPKLMLISLDSIDLQEEYDEVRVKKLLSKFKKSRTLIDPPIVSKGLGNKYIQLDGTNRIVTLKKLKCSHAVVQMVDYHDTSQVNIKSWVHTSKVDKNVFIKKLHEIPHIKTESFTLGLGVTLTGHPMASATIIFRDGKGLSVYTESDLYKKVQLLTDVVNLYKKLIKRNAQISIESMSDLTLFFAQRKEMNVGLFFPTFSSQQIYGLIEKKMTLPPGVTRHIINGRILGINYPTPMLHQKLSDKKKKEFFKNFIAELDYRFYEESVNVAD